MPAADSSLALSPEQLHALAASRLKAKEKLQAQEQERLSRRARASTSSTTRGLQVIPAESTSPTAPGQRRSGGLSSSATASSSAALQNAIASGSGTTSGQGQGGGHFKRGADDPAVPLKNMIGTYVEYDLSTLKNSNGGFLLESEENDPRRLKELKLVEENKRKRLETMRKQGLLHEPGRSLDPADNPKCVHCGSLELDVQLRAVFKVFVCAKCKGERPDQYSLLTKTECREDYLLTEPELKDEELLPHLLRPNPHRPTYSNMMLFLRMQVEAYAFSDRKWGSEAALDEEFAKRQAEKDEKKKKKFEKSLKELRKKTKTNVWLKRKDEEHQHLFVEARNDEGENVHRCEECGFEVEVEVF